MADFCKQCSIEAFNEDFRDLAGIAVEGRVAQTLCEGCGITFVDKDGECVGENCFKDHGKGDSNEHL